MIPARGASHVPRDIEYCPTTIDERQTAWFAARVSPGTNEVILSFPVLQGAGHACHRRLS